MAAEPFLKGITLLRDRVETPDVYPFSIFIGENGSGKSTVLEAIAVHEGFNPEGGSRNFNFSTRDSHSELSQHLRITRGARRLGRSDGFFFRAESFYNVATEVDSLALEKFYGGRSLHAQSHRRGVAVRDRDALADPHGLPRRDDLPVLRARHRADRIHGHRAFSRYEVVP
jgi:predicted ATPase